MTEEGWELAAASAVEQQEEEGAAVEAVVSQLPSILLLGSFRFILRELFTLNF